MVSRKSAFLSNEKTRDTLVFEFRKSRNWLASVPGVTRIASVIFNSVRHCGRSANINKAKTERAIAKILSFKRRRSCLRAAVQINPIKMKRAVISKIRREGFPVVILRGPQFKSVLPISGSNASTIQFRLQYLRWEEELGVVKYSTSLFQLN